MRLAYLLQLGLLIIAISLAWIRGGQPERAAAAAIASMYVLDPIYHATWGQVTTYDDINAGHLVIDLIAWIAMVTIAVRANRWWTLWLASAQTISVLSHFLRGAFEVMHPWVYAAMGRGPSWLEIALLFVGTALYHRRQRARLQRLPRS
jgi:hypothetical protein